METKKPKKPRKPRATVISEAQEAYVEAILDGKSKPEAALTAGYSHGQSFAAAERSQLVQNALAERREELSSATQITRVGVLNGILEAIEMARLQGDPTAMLTGYRDISKMMGFNAPEVKKIDITANQGRLRSKMQSMSDEELLRIAEGDDDVIEGEFRVVN